MLPTPVSGYAAGAGMGVRRTRIFARLWGPDEKFFNTSTHHATAERIFFPYIQLIALSIQQSSWVFPIARLAQSVERETLNLKVVGSTPTSGSIHVSD
ncbi:hypothetical protein CKAH01_18512 [Colletotrichum kahawae]|uniref:Uncharacterized protein n=1 Tax=Colletotrichum kahawae TaxID=34407 RepID=A0AAE0D3Z3_COLKA|nr:hypothetical protein CKAH01_18512 [Colletotrichum kahawae]